MNRLLVIPQCLNIHTTLLQLQPTMVQRLPVEHISTLSQCLIQITAHQIPQATHILLLHRQLLFFVSYVTPCAFSLSEAKLDA